MSPVPSVAILDANLLLRLTSKSHPHHAIAQSATRFLRASGVQLRTVPQAAFEFWVVATRDPKLNGLGLSAADAETVLDALLRIYPVIPDDPALLTYWRQLVAQNGIIGKPAHDARYIVAMQASR